MDKISSIPLNDKGQPHGYREVYYDNGTLWYKGTYHNGERVGYWEYHTSLGRETYKTYNIK